MVILVLVLALATLSPQAAHAGAVYEPDSTATDARAYEAVPLTKKEVPSDPPETPPVTRWVTEHEERVQPEIVARYEYFVDDGMSEAYTHCFGLLFNHVTYSRTNTWLEGKDYGLLADIVGRGGAGILFASGTPLRNSSNFEVIDSDIFIIAMPVGITILHGLEAGTERSVVPYVGWGFGGVFGFERISGNVTRAGTDEGFEWHDTCYRQSFTGHALLGLQWGGSGRYRGVVEARWTQGGKGRLKRGRFSAEDASLGWDEVFEEFQHPDFNFTGITLDVGLRW
jgi:hypothetical protein